MCENQTVVDTVIENILSDVDQPPDSKSDPTTQQGYPAPTKPGPAASSVKPCNPVSITNTATQVGQTTLQKLSNRI